MSLSNCRIIKLPVLNDQRGNLTFVETGQHLDFEIKRNYLLYDVPRDDVRGLHAHKTLRQLLICLNGSLDITLDDGERSKTYCLNKPSKGLYIGPMIWRELKNFSPGAICSVLASDIYDPNDYIHDYNLFVNMRTKQ